MVKLIIPLANLGVLFWMSGNSANNESGIFSVTLTAGEF